MKIKVNIMNSTALKSERLVARVSQDVQELIQQAAELSGATISQFLVESATSKAHSVITQSQTIRLSMQGAQAIFEALENPPSPNNKLRAAAQRYNKGDIFNDDNRTNQAT
jgi:uncharacterized protein (DUF1778 family)